MTWRQTGEEYATAAFIRALRRDPIANKSNGSRGYIEHLITMLLTGEYVLVSRDSEAHMTNPQSETNQLLQQIADGMKDDSYWQAIDELKDTINEASRRVEDGLLAIAKALRERNP